MHVEGFTAGIHVKESRGFPRAGEPIRIGIPFPRGLVFYPNDVAVLDQDSQWIPHQLRVLAWWSDRSVKWLLVDALVTVGAHKNAVLRLGRRTSATDAVRRDAASVLEIAEEADYLLVDTGSGQFRLSRASSGLFQAVRLGSTELLAAAGCDARLRTADGREHAPVVERVFVEENGPVTASILVEGGFTDGGWRIPLHFKSRMRFVAGSALVRIEFQIRNPQAAHHPGGLWDLGDGGSSTFRDLSIRLYPQSPVQDVQWYTEDPGDMQRGDYKYFSLYQDSSGGENWDSPNHIDFASKPTVSFSGYRVTAGSTDERRLVGEGQRATPFLRISTDGGWIAATTKNFWQNFPKALRIEDNVLSIGLFPSECRACFELQGGEQKRHVVYLDFGLPVNESGISRLQHPIEVSVDPAWVEQSAAIPWFVCAERDANQTYLDYINHIVEGPNSFFRKREIVDEYGWRNFGDLYADHEAIRHCGPKPMVSHYNNQYDFIYGAGVQFLRTGDRRWFQLMDEAAQHTIDIDIYHTDEDRPVYNHGLFWHTDHYKDAGTCTHRTYSRRNAGAEDYGGGPSNEHNYTSGLLLYFCLTGDQEARGAVVELADWVVTMDDGAQTILGLVDEGPTGWASKTVSLLYHKPGRGAANSINALMDAYELTADRRYFGQTELLIQRCIHPRDDIATLNLDEPEYRWSYLVFLQVLGKYLDTKVSFGEIDYYFYYARDSLLHYAHWMMINEVPYKDILHKVEIPTETWPAHDIRKSHVLHLAARYGPSSAKSAFHGKASFFFERCLSDVLSFATAWTTRPLVILTVCGYVQAYFEKHLHFGPEFARHGYEFGCCKEFVPQRERVTSAISAKLRIVGMEVCSLTRLTWQGLKDRLRNRWRPTHGA